MKKKTRNKKIYILFSQIIQNKEISIIYKDTIIIYRFSNSVMPIQALKIEGSYYIHT